MTTPDEKTNAPYIVLRPFSAGGCNWQPNEIFNESLCSPRQIRQLMDQRKLKRDGVVTTPMSRRREQWLGINAKSTLSVRPSSVRIKRRRVKADSEWNGKEGHIYYKHSGKGKYRVFEGEVAISDAMKQDEAAALAAEVAAERREGKTA